MSSQKKTDAFEKIQDFQKAILSKKPAVAEMIHDVRMMNFKVRPITGDVSDLDFKNPEFIDALWSLGKLDEFFRSEYLELEEHDQDVFFRLVDDMRTNFQQQLNKANIASIEFAEKPRKSFEVEIIKDSNWKVN